MTAPILSTQTPAERDRAIAQGAEALRQGKLVVFPTETVYGVAAAVGVAGNAGEKALRELKQRSDHQPFTVHLPYPEAVDRYLDQTAQPLLRRLVRRTMPGPITLAGAVSAQTQAQKVRAMG